jgi:phospholipid-binding lipoprotein MlaA
MTEPVTAISSMLRGESVNANLAAKRFVVNMVLGYGGLVDRATERGIIADRKNLGQALCSYGIPEGPFMVVPFYGPTTVSDFLAAMVLPLAGYATFGMPFAAYRAGSGLSAIVDEEGRLAPSSSESGENYEALRADYLEQRRKACAPEEEKKAQTGKD